MLRRFRNFQFKGLRSPELIVENGQVVSLAEGIGFHTDDGVDLDGAWLAPAFNDSHCHILPTGLDLQKLHLGSCQTHGDVLQAVRDRLPDIEPGQWLHAVHYDQTKFPGAEHLHRDQLDAISTETPILLRHVNGHASVANSAALSAAGIREDEPDPTGGTFVRDGEGRLTGVLLERAHEIVTSRAPEPSLDQMVDAILAAARAMAAFGITAASDMMTGRWDLVKELEAYRLASQSGSPVRFTLWMQWATVLGPRAAAKHRIEEQVRLMDPTRCAIGGLKIFADGAIGSATAAIYGRFETDPDDGRATSGTVIYAPEKLNDMMRKAVDAGYRVAVHAIGDRAVDLTLDAFEASGNPSVHRLEHAMLLSDEQIQRLAKVGCFVTMQPEFLHRFGHAYKVQLGAARASMLKRARSVKDAGLTLAFNSDRPIVLGDPLIGIATAANRPEGFDPRENLTRQEAIAAYTELGATINGQEGWLGQLKPGYVADFCLFDQNPESAPSPKLLATYRGGELVHLG